MSGAFSASATQALYPNFGNHQIYQLQHAETESALNVVRLLSAETECPPKGPKFGRPLDDDVVESVQCSVYDVQQLRSDPVIHKGSLEIQ